MRDSYSGVLPDPRSEPLLTVSRVAAIMGCSRSTAYAAVEAGTIPSIRVTRHTIRVPTALLANLLGVTFAPPDGGTQEA